MNIAAVAGGRAGIAEPSADPQRDPFCGDDAAAGLESFPTEKIRQAATRRLSLLDEHPRRSSAATADSGAIEPAGRVRIG